MRVFPQLCMRARMAGATRLVFTAELDEALVDVANGVGTDRGWCWQAGNRTEDCVAQAWGRSGEDALRRLVDMLEARK